MRQITSIEFVRATQEPTYHLPTLADFEQAEETTYSPESILSDTCSLADSMAWEYAKRKDGAK